MWIDDEDAVAEESQSAQSKRHYLGKKWHQVVEIMTFFFLGGTDYTLVFFMGAALVARGTQTPASVAVFSSVYYIAMTVARMFFGWVSKYFKEIIVIRSGIVLSILGIGLVYFTGHVAGMALIGFGLGPLLPTLVSDTSNRFEPRSISRIVGYELAAFGAGIAVLFFITSKLLHFVSYEKLFPLGLGFVVLVFICNEVLERERKNAMQLAENLDAGQLASEQN
jgi:MFS family permease